MTQKINIDDKLTGVITLRSIWSKDRKAYVEPVKNPKDGWYKGVDRLSEAEKAKRKVWIDPEKAKYTLVHGTTFDLNQDHDKINWEWIQYCKEVAHSFEEAQSSKDALFYIDSEDREDQKGLDNDKLLFKAMSYVNDDTNEQLFFRSRLLGFNMDGEKPNAVRKFLFSMAKNIETAGKVIHVYESNAMSVQLLFMRARDKDIIKHTNGIFIYGKLPIGVSEEAAVAYLSDPLQRELALEISAMVDGRTPVKKE